MKWISVKDQLPEANKEVLLVRREIIFIGFWNTCTLTNELKWRFSDGYETSLDEDEYPTYWMPLPEAPKDS